MILDHNIALGAESPTNEQTCTVNLRVSQLLCTNLIDILETDDGKLQLNYDAEQNHPPLVRTFSFSFNELRHSPWMCTRWFRDQLSRIVVMDSATRKKVGDEIVGRAAQLAYFREREQTLDSGYMFEATLELVHFHLSCIERGRYEGGGDGGEETTCSVCLEGLEVGKEFSKLPCSHVFHASCVDSWLERNNTCPNCRNELGYRDDTEEMLVKYLRQNAAAGRFPESPTNEQTCTVNLRVSQLLCTNLIDILKTDDGKLQLNYDAEQNHPSFLRTFSFSFDELRHSPWMCTRWLRDQLSRILFMDSATRKKVGDEIVGRAAQLAYFREREQTLDSGYMFEATLELVHFHLSCIERGRYEARGEGGEETTCSVCLEGLEEGKEFSKLPCSHVFHASCVDSWLERNNTCPNCRNELGYRDDTEEMLVKYLRQNAAAGRFPGA
ncbi:hypothetical protein ACET3Z_032894 [Daucus carota]